jgi:hypothetical protein
MSAMPTLPEPLPEPPDDPLGLDELHAASPIAALSAAVAVTVATAARRARSRGRLLRGSAGLALFGELAMMLGPLFLNRPPTAAQWDNVGST